MRGLSDSICEVRQQKILSLVSELPEASAQVCGSRHLSFKVRGKTFKIDWTQVEDVITEAYRLVAPRTLVSQIRKT
jgi:hypothetical protein